MDFLASTFDYPHLAIDTAFSVIHPLSSAFYNTKKRNEYQYQ